MTSSSLKRIILLSELGNVEYILSIEICKYNRYPLHTSTDVE